MYYPNQIKRVYFYQIAVLIHGSLEVGLAPNSLPCADGAVKNLLTHWRPDLAKNAAVKQRQTFLTEEILEILPPHVVRNVGHKQTDLCIFVSVKISVPI